MKNNKVIIENAQLIFRNFSGKEGKFNPGGNRSFCVVLDEEKSKELLDLGYNVRYLKPRNEDEKPTPYLQVKVTYGKVEPSIYLVGKTKTLLSEDNIGMLDWADISNADLQIRPYKWEMAGKTGTAAYLDVLYVTIQENVLEEKYRDSNSEPIFTSDPLPF